MPEENSPTVKKFSARLHKFYNRIRSKSQEPRGHNLSPGTTNGTGELFGNKSSSLRPDTRSLTLNDGASGISTNPLSNISSAADVDVVVVPPTSLEEGLDTEILTNLIPQKEKPLLLTQSHRQTSQNTLKATLGVFSNLLDGLPLPGAKGVVETIIKLIRIFEATVSNSEMLQDLNVRCLRLLDVVINPLTNKNEFEISPEFKTIVQRLQSRLLKLLAEIEAPQMGIITRMVNQEDITLALKDINDKLNQLIDFFMLETHVLGILSQEKLAKSVKKHTLHQLIQSLPRTNAAYDSYLDTAQTRSVCFPNTRQQLLGEIMEWMTSTDPNKPSLYILDGIAGIGKSTVAQTIAERCAQLGYLGASFFFSTKEKDRRTARLFFSTLAFDLACYSQEFAHAIHAALEQTPNAAEKSLHQQLQYLLVEPLKGLSLKHPIVLIVDALDECDKTEAQIILSLLSSNIQGLPGFKIFLTTRPEHHIGKVLQKCRAYDQFHLHEIEASVVEADIGSYLAYELSAPSIQAILPESTWEPNKEQFNDLVTNAGRLFIIASTAIRFILDERKRDPQSQVTKMLGAFRKETNLDVTNVLDGMYFEILQCGILDGSDEDDISLFQKVVGTIIVLENPLPLHSLAAFLSIREGEVLRALLPMHSIIAPHTGDQAPQIYHKSFPDFITDLGRCRDQRLYIAVDIHHAEVAMHCLEILNSKLHQNMCKLEGNDKLKFNADIDVEGLFMSKIGPEFRYACIYWATHLSKASMDYQKDLVEMLKVLSFTHILHWLEALSWLGDMDCAYSAVMMAQKYVAKLHEEKLQLMLSDIGHTVTKYYSVITEAAMHIYSSIIPFLPKRTMVYTTYSLDQEHGIVVVKGQEQDWGALLAVTGQHLNWVASVTYSLDGMRLASGSLDGMVYIWDGITGSSIATLEGHSDWVSSVVFSPDGSLLASGSHDNTVRLWDALTYSPIITLQHSHQVRSISFSHDGSRLASGAGDGTARLWDGVAGAPLAILEGHSKSVSSIMFSSDGLRLATYSDDNSVRLWDGITGAPIATLEGHSNLVTSLVFSSDGFMLASGSHDKTARLWNGFTGSPIAILEGHLKEVSSVAFSPDGSKLASGAGDNMIKLWNGLTGSLITTLEGHSDWVKSVKFSPDGTIIASSSEDNTMRLWNGLTGVPVAVLEGNNYFKHFVFSPDGLRLACGSGALVQIWNALSTDKNHSNRVTSVVFSPDGSRLASGVEDGLVKLWNVLTGKIISTLEGHTGYITSVVFSPDGSILASSSIDKTVRTWDGVTGAAVTIYEGHTDWIDSVAFSPDGFMLASASRDKTTILWNVPTGKSVATLKGHSNFVTVVTFSPDGYRLASGSWDCEARLWNGVTGAPIATLEGHSDWVSSVTFSPDGSILASASNDNTVRLWDGFTGALLTKLEDHSTWVASIEFSPDGSRLAAGLDNNTVKLWNGVTGTPIATLEGHLGPVLSAVFSPDGSWLVSVSRDNTVRFWCFAGVSGPVSEAVSHTLDTHPGSILDNVHEALQFENSSNSQSRGMTSQSPAINTTDTSIFCIPADAPPSTRLSISRTHIAYGSRNGHVIILSVPFLDERKV